MHRLLPNKQAQAHLQRDSTHFQSSLMAIDISRYVSLAVILPKHRESKSGGEITGWKVDLVTKDKMEEFQVVVVGASMVGMTLAALLKKHGVNVVNLERHPSTAIYPKAAHFHAYTIEILRWLGLYDIIVEESTKAYDPNAGINAVKTLKDGEFQRYLANLNDKVEQISSAKRLFLTQHIYEPVMRNLCKELNMPLIFSTEVTSIKNVTDGVIVETKALDRDERKTYKAKYVVVCDGSKSPLRDKLQISLKGRGLLSNSATIYFNADVSKYLESFASNGVIYVTNEKVRGFFRIDKTGKSGFIAVFTAGEPGTEAARYFGDRVSDEDCKRILLDAIGEDIPVDVTYVSRWKATSDYAERFSEDRIFLCGDNATTVPPTGGFGGNTGIQAAFNLAWKLKMVVCDKCNPRMLDSYEEERLPVGYLTVEQAYTRYVLRSAPELRDDTLQPQVADWNMELGYRYNHSSIIAYDNAKPEEITEDPFNPGAYPGCRAPHAVVKLSGETKEVFLRDLIRSKYVLFTSNHAWKDAAAQIGLLEIYELQTDRWLDLYKLQKEGAIIVRPDGFIAWKTQDQPQTGNLQKVLAKLTAA